MKNFILHLTIIVILVLAGCEGPAGPAGSDIGSLDDPSVIPAVVYTYPPMNSEGPYPDFYISSCTYGDCPYYSMIQVRFNKFMDVPSVRRAVSLSSSAGGIRVDASRVVSFGGDVVMVTPVDSPGYSTYVEYDVGETYTLGIDTTARDMNGNHLPAPFSMTFVPEPYFRVTGMSPPDGGTGVNPQSSVTLAFNAEVDSGVVPFIRMSPPTAFRVYVYKGGRMAYLAFDQPLADLQSYVVTVDSGAPDAAGHRLASSFRGRFTTSGFGVTYAYPTDGSNLVTLTYPVSVSFSSSIDTSTARGAFSIEPPVDGALTLSTYYGGSQIVFRPAGGWDASTTYVVRLDTTLRSLSGVALPQPWRTSFTTDRFRISYVSASYSPDWGASRYPYFNVITNGPVDTMTIPSSVGLDPPVSLIFSRSSDVNRFIAVPSELLEPSTRYTLTVDTTLKTLRGVRLAAPYAYTFVTAPLE